MRIFCDICSHSQAESVRARLLDGESLRIVAGEYGLPVRGLRYHRDEHVLRAGRRNRGTGQEEDTYGPQ